MKINKIIQNLVISDFFIVGSLGLISPIFAIFIEDKIVGGNIEVIGFSWTIYLISKSAVLLPAARIVDRIKGEKDDFFFVFIGSIFFSLIPLSYIFISTISGLYLIQFIYGIISGITVPAWNAIYTRHIDKKHEGFEWGVWEMSVGVGSALASAIGGMIAYRLGFNVLFIIASLFSLLGTFFISKIYKDLHDINIFKMFIEKIKS